MKIFFNGFYSGFLENKNPGTNVDFFIYLFKKIYNTDSVEISNLNDSNILCEFDALINTKSAVNIKKWQHTYLFNGESKCLCDTNKYDCVLFGERNNNNIVNLPLYISYLFSNKINFDNINKIDKVPKKDICVVISNPNGSKRNYILSNLEKYFTIDYLGRYKNNSGYILNAAYNSNEFKEKISEYKFIISMENSRKDTYITEKIILGLNAEIIPIYWGSKNIYDYFNKERILALLENDNTKLDIEINKLIEKINLIKNDDKLWLDIVNRSCYPLNILEENSNFRNIDDVISDIKNLLKIDNKNYYNSVSKIYTIANKEFENNNYNSVSKFLLNDLNLNENLIKFMSPTYKNLITDKLFSKYFKSINLNPKFLNRNIKRSELSLILNYKSILEDIVKNYKNGLFIILESDILPNKDINKLNDFINFIKDKEWDFIHLGEHHNNIFGNTSIELFEKFDNNKLIEDITNKDSKYRIIRKLHTRCTDSIIWKYNAIQKFLDYMNENDNYNLALDYYIIKYLEKNKDVKHYWTINNFFINGSNNGFLKTNIQNDIN